MDLEYKVNQDIDEPYEQFISQIISGAKKAKALKILGRKQRISKETVNLMVGRAHMKLEGKMDEEYRTLCKEIHVKIKEDYKDFRKKKLREAAKKSKSLKKVERDVSLKQIILEALKAER
ncbi:unnamed protein product [Caretta caretta]